MGISHRRRVAAYAGVATLGAAGLAVAAAPPPALAAPAATNQRPTVHVVNGSCGSVRRQVLHFRFWDDRTPREKLSYGIAYNSNPGLFESLPWWNAGIEHRLSVNTVVDPVGVADLVIMVRDAEGNTTRFPLTYRTGFTSMTGTDRTDVMIGTAGHNTIRTFGGNDVVCGGPGFDTIETGPGNDIAHGGEGRDLLHGGAGSDLLDGGGDGDWLYGFTGRDRLIGGAGNDVLDGGLDRDLMAGGLGADRFVATPGDALPDVDTAAGDRVFRIG